MSCLNINGESELSVKEAIFYDDLASNYRHTAQLIIGVPTSKSGLTAGEHLVESFSASFNHVCVAASGLVKTASSSLVFTFSIVFQHTTIMESKPARSR